MARLPLACSISTFRGAERGCPCQVSQLARAVRLGILIRQVVQIVPGNVTVTGQARSPQRTRRQNLRRPKRITRSRKVHFGVILWMHDSRSPGSRHVPSQSPQQCLQ
jgi:hypothetical protein